MLKADVSNGFYWIGLRPADAPKLGLIFPVDGGTEPLVAIPLTLPIRWKNLPPLFCTAMENVADLLNQALQEHTPLRPHKQDDMEASVVTTASPTLDPTLVPLSWDPLLLCANAQLLVYVDIFFDDFLGLAQGPTHQRRQVCRILFHTLDKVFRPLEKLDPPQRKESLLLKKMDTCDCSWSTYQVLLFWVVDTFNMKMCLPTHQATRIREILFTTPPTPPSADHRQTLVPGSLESPVHGTCPSWCQRSVQIHARSLAPREWEKGYADTRGACCPVRLPVVSRRPGKPPNPPLRVSAPLPDVDGYHDASGTIYEGFLLPGPTAVPWEMQAYPSTDLPPQTQNPPSPLSGIPPSLLMCWPTWSAGPTPRAAIQTQTWKWPEVSNNTMVSQIVFMCRNAQSYPGQTTW